MGKARKDQEVEGHGGTAEARPLRESRRLRFTDVGIRSLRPGAGRPIDYSDQVTRGLRLRVSPSGERIFLLAYKRPKDGQRVKLSIGSLSERLTLAQARREAGTLLALLRREPPIDPGVERARRRETAKANAAAASFADACDAYVAEELPEMRPATRAGWLRFIEKEIKPALGNLKPEDIRPQDIAELRSTIERGIAGAKKGTWERKPAPVSARRAFEVLRRILAWLSTADPDVEHVRKRYGLRRLEVNPAASATTFRRRKRAGKKTRAEASAKALTDDQLRRVFAAAEDAVLRARAEREAMKKRELSGPTAHEVEARAFANLLSLVAHTGVRAHDARSARLEDIDEGRGLWTIAEHKTSDHTGAPHVVPLSDGAVGVLARIREANLEAGYGRSAWLFPADTGECEVCERPGHIDKDAKAARRIKAAADIASRGLLHRLRDTLRTRLSEHGTDARVAEAILAHVPAGIVGTYDHAELLPQRREALDWWAGELARILGEAAPKPQEVRA